MKRLIAVLIVVAVGSCWIAWRQHFGAREQLGASQAQLTAIERDVTEIAALRGRDQRIAERRPPERDVIARVTQALARADLPAEALGSITPESDAALPGSPNFRRQSLRLSLRAVELEGFGAFLNAWRKSQIVWTITQIELQHSRQRGCEECYDATLVLSALYVQGGDA